MKQRCVFSFKLSCKNKSSPSAYRRIKPQNRILPLLCQRWNRCGDKSYRHIKHDFYFVLSVFISNICRTAHKIKCANAMSLCGFTFSNRNFVLIIIFIYPIIIIIIIRILSVLINKILCKVSVALLNTFSISRQIYTLPLKAIFTIAFKRVKPMSFPKALVNRF